MPQLPPDGERLVTEFSGAIVLEHLHRYAIANMYTAGKDALDIACGEGYGSNLISLNAKSVVGVDISLDAISHASGKYKRENLKFIHGTCLAIPVPDQSIDIAVSFETIEHLIEHETFLQEVKRILRPDGILIISSPDSGKHTDNNNPYHLKELSHLEFRDLIKSHFKNTLFGQQLYAPGTIIEMEAPSSLDYISGDYTKNTYSTLAHEAAYSIALASNHTLPPARGSVYLNSNYKQNSAQDQFIGCDVFIGQDGSFTQEKSTPALYFSNEKRLINFNYIDKHAKPGPIHLRLDPADRPCLIKFTRVTLVKHITLNQVTSRHNYDVTKDLIPLFHLIKIETKPDSYIATGNDPQILLPVSTWDGETHLSLEVELTTSVLAPDYIFGISRYIEERNDSIKALIERVAKSDTKVGDLQAMLAKARASISHLENTLAERKTIITSLQDTLSERNNTIASLQNTLRQRESSIADALYQLSMKSDNLLLIQKSLSWKITAPLRFIKRQVR